MSKYYSVIDLSKNISKTPEGYLVCKGAAIARAGDLMYQSYETGIDSDTGVTVMTRTIEDLCSPETIASFEGKPITIGHPEGGGQFVGPDNWQDFAVGNVQNVRQGEEFDSDKLIADLIITDREGIQKVEDGELRELSCGYDADFKKLGDGKGQQTNIVGNHVAMVKNGRCGSQCAIFDSAHGIENTVDKLENKRMSKIEKLKKMLGKDVGKAVDKAIDKAIDEAMPDDEKKATDADRLSAVESQMAKFDEYMASNMSKDEAEPEAPTVEDEEGDQNEKQDGRLDQIESMLMKIMAAVLPTADEDKKDGEDEDKKKVPASDQETLSRAEILAPGIEDGEEIKKRSLDASYKTPEGKAIIDELLCGKAFDSADHDTLFVCASKMIGANRDLKTNSMQRSKANDSKGKTAMTAEELQAHHDAFYANANK